jgi:hypothetical protein
MIDKQVRDDNVALEFAKEEYKTLWDYYKKTLEEREITLNYYFRTVTIPSAALAVALLAQLRLQPSDGLAINTDYVSPILIVIFLVGVSCLLKYRLEAENARDYIRAINQIRDLFISEFPPLSSHLLFAQKINSLPFALSIPFYGSAVIVLINSAALTAYVQTVAPSGLFYMSVTFSLLVVAQVFLSEGLAHLRRVFRIR